MSSIAKEYIDDYFNKILDTHLNSFGINEELKNNSYLNLRYDILRVFNFVTVIDSEIKTRLAIKMVNDILNLTKFLEDFETGSDRINTIYEFFIKNNPGNYNKDEVISIFKDEFKKNKDTILKLLNTKLFYFDKYLWYKILNSNNVKKMFKVVGANNIRNTLDYVKFVKNRTDEDENIIEFVPSNSNIFARYTPHEIEEIKNLEDNELKIEDEALKSLIDSKDKIKFFNGMDIEDILYIVSDVKFKKYNKHEAIIEQGKDDKDVYFLLAGECRVQAGRATLGLIRQGQIFGEFSVLTDEIRAATIKANKPSVVISFKIDLSKFDTNPYAYTFFYRNVALELIKKIKIANSKAS